MTFYIVRVKVLANQKSELRILAKDSLYFLEAEPE
jgi:hypothetical protein